MFLNVDAIWVQKRKYTPELDAKIWNNLLNFNNVLNHWILKLVINKNYKNIILNVNDNLIKIFLSNNLH